MSKKYYLPTTIYSKYTANVRSTKCLSMIDGPNMWNIEVNVDRKWYKAACLYPKLTEQIIGKSIPRYTRKEVKKERRLIREYTKRKRK